MSTKDIEKLEWDLDHPIGAEPPVAVSPGHNVASLMRAMQTGAPG